MGKNRDQVIAYVKSIYEFLQAVENDTSCFVAGSFVIADPDKKLSTLLRSATTAVVPPITHNIFCNNCLQYEIHIKGGIDVQCPRKSKYTEIKKSLKWYSFTRGDNKRYVFLKLERDGTYATAHLRRAGSRYITNRHAFKLNIFSRREDPPKPWVDRSYRKNDPKGLRSTTRLPSTPNPLRVDRNRKTVCCGPELWAGEGDEYFLCAELSEFFLELAQNGEMTDTQVEPLKACQPQGVAPLGG